MTGSPLSRKSETAALQARIDELEDERERLRRRTHEIQEAADKKMGKLESRVAQYRNRFAAARERVAPWVATWTTDPPSQERFGWWRYASQDQIDEITALVSEVRDGQAERDRLREWAEGQCRQRAREYEQASGMEPESISDDEAWALYGPDAR